MRTLITNFHNEAYLLPWWLKHHREIFDHGVMLNDNSTDNSCDIIRELVPHWEIIDIGENEMSFKHPFDLDMMIMNQESRFQGWKMHLNVTEFLCATNLDEIENEIEGSRNIEDRPLEGAIGRGVIMIEPNGDSEPGYDKSLIAQNHFGFFEDRSPDEVAPYRPMMAFLWSKYNYDPQPPKPKFYQRLMGAKQKPHTPKGNNYWYRPGIGLRLLRSRIYHKRRHGFYTPGRHSSWANLYWGGMFRPVKNDMMILWYGLNPWNDKMRERYLEIDSMRESNSHNITANDKDWGLQKFYQDHLNDRPFDLMNHKGFKACVEKFI